MAPPLELGQPAGQAAGQTARAGTGSVLRRPVLRDVLGRRGVAIGNPPRAGGCQWTRTMGARRRAGGSPGSTVPRRQGPARVAFAGKLPLFALLVRVLLPGSRLLALRGPPLQL